MKRDLSIPFYEGDDPQAGAPMSLLMEGATRAPVIATRGEEP
jgi:hypothetical protein